MWMVRDVLATFIRVPQQQSLTEASRDWADVSCVDSYEEVQEELVALEHHSSKSRESAKIMVLSMITATLTALALVVTLWVPYCLGAGGGTAGPAGAGAVEEYGWEQALEVDKFRVSQHRSTSKKWYEVLRDSEQTFYDEESEVLGSTILSKNTYSRQPYVANGYIGSRVPNLGFGYALDELNIWTENSSVPGALNNGWPLRNHRFAGAFVSDFYSLQEKLNSTNFKELDDHGYSTVISSIPQWTDIRISAFQEGENEDKLERTTLSPMGTDLGQITGYMQNLSLADGIVATEFDWLGKLHVKTSIIAHRTLFPLGLVRMELSLVQGGVDDDGEPTGTITTVNDDNSVDADDVSYINLELEDVLNYTSSHRTSLTSWGYDKDGIYMVVEPDNVPYSNASIYSSWNVIGGANASVLTRQVFDDAVTQSKRLRLTLEHPRVTIEKYVGIVSSEYNDMPISNLESAREIVHQNYGSFAALVESHRAAWADLYSNASIEIPSDYLLELAAKSSLYHMLANTRSHNVSPSRGLPVPVGGLSSDSYGGMVFWDMDTWMLPGILPFFPDIAKEMANYRNTTHAQAVENARQYNYSGALYPWTSGRFANCTSTGPCVDYEYHLNIDIAMSFLSIYMNGAEGIDDEYLRYTAWPHIRDAALFFTEYVQYNKSLDAYTTHNMTDPDEFADFIDNGAFTNSGIKTLLKWAVDVANHLGEEVNPQWADISNKIHIPTSPSNITLEYTGMNATVDIKQADVLLMVYPLGYITDESILNNAIQNLYYYTERQSAAGPAMTYPVFVAASSALLNHGSSSQSYLYKSVVPYMRSPFLQFSEQSDDNFLTNGLTQPAFPFLTANGGYLQSILFGLTGLRYSYTVNPETLKMERLLKFNPVAMPMLPGGIRINNFKYMGQVLDISIGDHNATIHHKLGVTPINIKVPDRSLLRDRDIPFATPGSDNNLLRRDMIDYRDLNDSNYYTVHPGEKLTLPVFTPYLNIDGNVAEGKQVTNLTRGVPGDVALSVLDGNNYTHWQPYNKTECALLLIDLGSEGDHELTHGKILWGGRPPKNISLSILPHYENMSNIFGNLTDLVQEYHSNDSYSTSKNPKDYVTVPKKGNHSDLADVDMGIREIFNWNLLDFDEVNILAPEVAPSFRNFVTVLRDYYVKPSQPFYYEVLNRSEIVILPSNVTDFKIDYDEVAELNPGYTGIDFNGNDTSWRKTRFVILAVEGTFDDDTDPKGATIKEVALMTD